MRRRVPDACAILQNVLSAAQLPDVDELANLLVAELSALPVALILVLDDYHRIRSRDVHAIIRHLLRYLPSRLHLVIPTRADPPLLALSEVLEIRLALLGGHVAKFNLLNCIRGGQRYPLLVQGDFCATASFCLSNTASKRIFAPHFSYRQVECAGIALNFMGKERGGRFFIAPRVRLHK